MSYTDSTANLKLPQWQENDYPSWLTDVNGAFRTIDQKVGEQDASIQQSLNDASGARTLATEASNSVTSLGGEVNSVKNDVSEVRELASAASTTANSAMDVAEIAQDTAEEVAGRTANITTNQGAWVHTVNNASHGGIEFNDAKTTLLGRSNQFSLISHGDGNIQSVTAGNVIKFDALNVLSRLAALEEFSAQQLTPLDSSYGTIYLVRFGKICVLSLWSLRANTPAYRDLCDVPSPIYSVGSTLNDSTGNPLGLVFIDPHQKLRINKQLVTDGFGTITYITSD